LFWRCGDNAYTFADQSGDDLGICSALIIRKSQFETEKGMIGVSFPSYRRSRFARPARRDTQFSGARHDHWRGKQRARCYDVCESSTTFQHLHDCDGIC